MVPDGMLGTSIESVQLHEDLIKHIFLIYLYMIELHTICTLFDSKIERAEEYWQLPLP